MQDRCTGSIAGDISYATELSLCSPVRVLLRFYVEALALTVDDGDCSGHCAILKICGGCISARHSTATGIPIGKRRPCKPLNVPLGTVRFSAVSAVVRLRHGRVGQFFVGLASLELWIWRGRCL
jgi:hypothetical protein